MDTETTLQTFMDKLRSAYGAGAEALPWQQIIAIIMQIISGCVPTPTPASLRQAIAKLKTLIQLHRRLLANGVDPHVVSRIVAAMVTVGHDPATTDDQYSAVIQAANETA